MRQLVGDSMSEGGVLEGMTELEETSINKILTSLIDGKNVELKTEINNPLGMAQLKILAKALKDEKMDTCSNTIIGFINDLNIFMVSFKRQSRKEIIAAVTEGLKQERDLPEKLTKTPSN